MKRPMISALAAVLLLPPAAALAQSPAAAQSSGAAPGPQWPTGPLATKGAPNVVLILIDDVGFSATATFGGAIHTPNFEALSKNGLRYNEFHVNSLCSPTRAALLSGRNNHQVGFGTVAEAASGYPGYNAQWGKNAASMAEILKANGYSTAAFGKWHNTPLWETTSAGPFDRWPTNRGFEHFYGFIQGADNQYYPRLFRDTVQVEPPATPEQGYNFTTDIASDAVHWLHAHDGIAPDKPFFLYFAPGAVHTPLQVSKQWIDKYKGKFDQGWDKLREETFARQKKLGVIPANAELTPRPEGLPAWDSLPAAEQKLLAHQAEVYAAFAEQADYEVGRVLQTIRDEGKSDNTLVLEIFGDNGGSAEGGIEGTDLLSDTGANASIAERAAVSDELGSEVFMNHYAAAWAWALSAPFQGTKQDASHLGGTRDPLVVSWPARIKNTGGLRTQFQHVNDVAPTIYEAAGIQFPSTFEGVPQIPLEGSSFLYTFDHPDEPSHHHVQYFATSGNRAIYKDGWWAGDRYAYTWEPRGAFTLGAHNDLDRHPWELYNLNEDYSQAHDLAAKNPEKLKELQALFQQEGERNHVFPLIPTLSQQPSSFNGRKVFVFRDGVERLPNRVGPQLVGRPHQITADVQVPATGGDGVIIAQGSRYGGFTLYVKDHHVIYEVNAYGKRAGRIVSTAPLVPGAAHIELQVIPEAPKANSGTLTILGPRGIRAGKVLLTVNDLQQEADFANVLGASPTETLDIGSDLGSAVSKDYISPNRYTGSIQTVTVELK
ncbi:arylsulfatase [Granulicella rosea]|uniref:Arylsulfatase n=1 Tax=Granulicella rosea TaxID=474952 RepID=A0A239K439_9BACT|nr:arylsulfatase [Granulicella rosea]SNT13107.1 arylsulfatase [Granulicella rosea]